MEAESKKEIKKLETATAQLKIRQEEEKKRVQSIQATKQVETAEEAKVIQAKVQLMDSRQKMLATFQQVLTCAHETLSEEDRPKISDLLMQALNIDMPERRRDSSNRIQKEEYN